MGINLGFESLGMTKADGELSYEYLDSLIQFNQSASDVLDLCHELTNTVRTYDNVNAISKCIKKYGVTRSLEALYGENFSSAASMEAENEEAKKGLVEKIKEIIRTLKKKIIRFFQWLFNQKERVKMQLMKLEFKSSFKFKGMNNEDVPVKDKNDFAAKRTKLIQAINALGKLKSELESQLDKAEKEKDVDKNKVDEIRQAIEETVKGDKAVIASANSFISEAKKAAGPHSPKSPDATPGEDPEADDTDYSQTAHGTDKRRTR